MATNHILEGFYPLCFVVFYFLFTLHCAPARASGDAKNRPRSSLQTPASNSRRQCKPVSLQKFCTTNQASKLLTRGFSLGIGRWKGPDTLLRILSSNAIITFGVETSVTNNCNILENYIFVVNI